MFDVVFEELMEKLTWNEEHVFEIVRHIVVLMNYSLQSSQKLMKLYSSHRMIVVNSIVDDHSQDNHHHYCIPMQNLRMEMHVRVECYYWRPGRDEDI